MARSGLGVCFWSLLIRSLILCPQVRTNLGGDTVLHPVHQSLSQTGRQCSHPDPDPIMTLTREMPSNGCPSLSDRVHRGRPLPGGLPSKHSREWSHRLPFSILVLTSCRLSLCVSVTGSCCLHFLAARAPGHVDVVGPAWGCVYSLPSCWLPFLQCKGGRTLPTRGTCRRPCLGQSHSKPLERTTLSWGGVTGEGPVSPVSPGRVGDRGHCRTEP